MTIDIDIAKEAILRYIKLLFKAFTRGFPYIAVTTVTTALLVNAILGLAPLSALGAVVAVIILASIAAGYTMMEPNENRIPK